MLRNLSQLGKHYDVVICGGGAMGSSAAYWLAKRSGGKASVLVVEPDSKYTRASTALSAGSIRHQFSIAENIQLSQFGTGFLRDLAPLAVDADIPTVNMVESGYLFLATPEGVPVLEANHQTQRQCGADVQLLCPDELAARFPWMSFDGVDQGSIGNSGEGWFDPYMLLQALRKKALDQGVTYVDARVVDMHCSDNTVTEVEVQSPNGDGESVRIGCGDVLNATGPWAAETAAMAGIQLPVKPRKRCTFVFDCPDAQEITNSPLVIDPSGLYFRREKLGPEGLFITGGPQPIPDPDVLDGDLEVEHHIFEEQLWEILATRVPVFEKVKVVSSWAGYYEYNTIDQNAIIGRHPQLTNFIMTNGFSGHGIQQSPAVGRAVSELVLDGGYQTIDCTPFGYERFDKNEPLLEKNII